MAPLRLAINALGTRAELVFDCAETPGLRAVGEEAIEEVRIWHDRLSLFQSDSLLSFINREAAQRAVTVDEDVWSLLALCQEIHRASDEAFDPTVAGLMSASGLHPEIVNGPVGWDSLVELDESARTIRFRHAAVRLDLGGIAKGFALDRAADVLHRHACEGALLHAGTSAIVSIGEVARRIAVRTGGGLFSTCIQDEAMCVSAPRGRTNGSTTHIMDPRALLSATEVDTAVVAGRGANACAECDAWATALVVRGERSAAVPGHLRAAVHDGEEWCCASFELESISEAA